MNDTLVSEIIVPADHPALAGHFPGNPIVPGVVLLDAVLDAIQSRRPCTLLAMPAVKFLQPVQPRERIELRVEITADQEALRARFQGRRQQSCVFEGTFVLSAGAAS